MASEPVTLTARVPQGKSRAPARHGPLHDRVARHGADRATERDPEKCHG